MPPRLKVVADRNTVESELLGQHRVLDKISRPELLGRGFVSEFQHDSSWTTVSDMGHYG
jgi:hypothetical protein